MAGRLMYTFSGPLGVYPMKLQNDCCFCAGMCQVALGALCLEWVHNNS